jgi:hypothetical protein
MSIAVDDSRVLVASKGHGKLAALPVGRPPMES